MGLKDLVADDRPANSLSHLLNFLHRTGPNSPEILHTLSAYKEFHPEAFGYFEEKIVASMGLFYKVRQPSSLYAFLISQMGSAHANSQGQVFTPVQASVRRALDENQFVSISAPTSAGKSFSIRDFIASGAGDAVVVVPSRALIAEYLAAIRRVFNENKDVMVLPFVDRVFTRRELRRIFVLTPERARELFEIGHELDIGVFFFDEAQVSEEPGRGVVFDVLVRRVRRSFPDAKLIFAHPFVENPDAQFSKHDLPRDRGFARTYPYGAVGKLNVFRHANGRDYYFSPFEQGGYHLRNCVEVEGGFDTFAFSSGHSVLVYVSKGSIYSGKFLEDFNEHIGRFRPVEDPDALEIIESISHAVGADQGGHRSLMVSLLKKGVVIHHGSVPLEVRFLVEDFVRRGFARICFATSTLVQGVNMPFDIVWLDTMRILGDDESARALAFKNLIGRAGRLSELEKFDYGFVFTKNPRMFTERIHEPYRLSEVSLIDDDADDDRGEGDVGELLSSIRDGSFDEQLHLPQSKVDRLARQEVLSAASEVLDYIYRDSHTAKESLGGAVNRGTRLRIDAALRRIYEASLDRQLKRGEIVVFSEAISLLLQTFQGRSFRELVGIRYSRISRRDSGHAGSAAFSQRANKLPDSGLEKPYSLFQQGTPASEVSYDAVVFDTYDYLDEVISFCLADTFIAAFRIYHAKSGDQRALKFVELLRFGTNDAMQILLIRYGFLPEDIDELLPYIQSISEQEITFRRTLSEASARIREITAWYR